jgi:hypothetical protein
MLALAVSVGYTADNKDKASDLVKITGADGVVIECTPDKSQLAKKLLPELEKRVKENEKQLSAIKAAANSLTDNHDEVVKFLHKELGLTAPKNQAAQGIAGLPAFVLHQLIAALPTGKQVKFYDANELKARLTNGETIPNFVLDPETGDVKLSLALSLDLSIVEGQQPTNNKSGGTVFPLIIKPATLEKELDEAVKQLDQINDSYNSIAPQVIGASIHEGAELAIVTNFNIITPFRRWFCDGMANYLTARCLEKFVSKDAAKSFLQSFDASNFIDYKDQIDLMHWRSEEWEENSPVQMDKELDNIAYVFATDEICKLIERHKPEVVPAIFTEIAKTQLPDEDTIFDAIQKVTKEDFRKVLAKYGSKAPKDNLSRLAIKSIVLDSSGSAPTDDKSKQVTIDKDGKSGISLKIDYAMPNLPASMTIELIGPAKSGERVVRKSSVENLSKMGSISKLFLIPGDVDLPGKYTVRLSLDEKQFKELEFDVSE